MLCFVCLVNALASLEQTIAGGEKAGVQRAEVDLPVRFSCLGFVCLVNAWTSLKQMIASGEKAGMQRAEANLQARFLCPPVIEPPS